MKKSDDISHFARQSVSIEKKNRHSNRYLIPPGKRVSGRKDKRMGWQKPQREKMCTKGM